MQIGLIQTVHINDLTDERCRKEQSIGYGHRIGYILDSVRYRNVKKREQGVVIYELWLKSVSLLTMPAYELQ